MVGGILERKREKVIVYGSGGNLVVELYCGVINISVEVLSFVLGFVVSCIVVVRLIFIVIYVVLRLSFSFESWEYRFLG